MRIVRDRAEARWLPSRYRFAIWRLGAYLRLRNAPPQPCAGLMLMIDADQSAIEVFSTSLWILLTTAAYVAMELSEWWPLALAIVAAIPLASVALQIPIYLMGTIVLPMLRVRSGHAAINSVMTWTLHIVVASYYATTRTWARFAAWQFLAMILVNAAAAVILFLLRDRVARLEACYAS